MGEDETSRGAGGPAALYAEQLDKLQRAQAADQRVERQLGFAKLAVAFLTVAAAIVLLYYVKFLWLLLVAAGVFAWLAVLHENRLRRIRQRARAIEFHALGLEERSFVPVNPQPAQAFEDAIHHLGRGAFEVGVLDPQNQRAAVVARVEPVEKSGTRSTDM